MIALNRSTICVAPYQRVLPSIAVGSITVGTQPICEYWSINHQLLIDQHFLMVVVTWLYLKTVCCCTIKMVGKLTTLVIYNLLHHYSK